MEGKRGFALCAEGILSITTNQRNTYTRERTSWSQPKKGLKIIEVQRL